jgi:hypothetical protein
LFVVTVRKENSVTARNQQTLQKQALLALAQCGCKLLQRHLLSLQLLLHHFTLIVAPGGRARVDSRLQNRQCLFGEQHILLRQCFALVQPLS